MAQESKLKVIIVEDEEKDSMVIAKILTDYYSHLVIIQGICQTVDDAIEKISSIKPDLVFLDIIIQGNRYGAFDILEKVNPDFQIIFITGNNDLEYYVKAIKTQCLDYIVKPTSIEDFAKPLAKAWENKRDLRNQLERSEYTKQLELFINSYKKQQTNQSIPIPVEYGHIIVKSSDIVKCLSEGNYTEIYLSNNTKKLANGNLKHFEELLSDYNIVRVHRQCMINLAHITSYSKKEGGKITLSNGDNIYIGDAWKDCFEKAYNRFFNIDEK
jgi:two-component system, LytTR family, response regulator